MRVELLSINNGIVELKINRVMGKPNTVTIPVEIDPTGLTENQKATKAWEQIEPTVLLMFSRVWDARETPHVSVFNDVPEFDEDGNIIWAERLDNTPINEDTLDWAVSPYDEPVEAEGFEFEDLPQPPIIPRTEAQKQADIENFAFEVYQAELKRTLAEEFLNSIPPRPLEGE